MVLRKRDEKWEEHRLAPSTRSAKAAIANVVNQDVDAGDVNGYEYVAIPIRSWRPVSVTVQTETKIKIG
jgi:hypothetical protein